MGMILAPQFIGMKGAAVSTTWNSADKGSGVALSNGDLTTAYAGVGDNDQGIRNTLSKTTGKFYIESTLHATVELLHGFATSTPCVQCPGGSNHASSWVLRGDINMMFDGANTSSVGTTPSNGDIMMMAVDIDAGKAWWGTNGTWYDGGDPGAGTGAHCTSVSGAIFVYQYNAGSRTETTTTNFGATAFSYTIPSGFTAWID